MEGTRTASSLLELQQTAQEIAPRLPRGVIIGLRGQLGAGKTAFVKALAAALGYSGEVRSPTFTLEHRYALPSGETIYHWDLYRLQSEAELLALDEVLGDSKAVILVEWPERISSLRCESEIEIVSDISGVRTLSFRKVSLANGHQRM